MNFFEKVKETLTIPQCWSKFNLPGSPKNNGVVKSPIRDDKNPSFSIFDGGRKFRDHASGDHGDVFDFVRLTQGCSEPEAIRILSELTGIENIDYDYKGLPMMKIEKPKVHASVQSFEIKPDKNTSGGREFVFNYCLNWLCGKRINPEIVCRLYSQGHISFEDRVLNYHYSTGTKTRWDWDSSRSTRWRHGKAADAVWLMHNITDQDSDERATIYITEGETDCMRLMSHPLMGEARVVAIPSASWVPSPVMAGTIGNSRDVVLCFDNDEAGRNLTLKVIKSLAENAFDCSVSSPFWFRCDNRKDLCECTDEEIASILCL